MAKLNKHQKKIQREYQEKEQEIAKWITTNFPKAFPPMVQKFFEAAMFRATNNKRWNFILEKLIWWFNIELRFAYEEDGRCRNVAIFKKGEMVKSFLPVETAIVTDLKKFQEEKENEQKEKT